MDWQDVHARIEERFSEGGVVCKSLLGVLAAERAYRDFILATYRGHRLVLDAFFEFQIETIQCAQQGLENCADRDGLHYFGPIQVSYLVYFRSFRAADNAFLSGYPLDGFALLRDLKDRALFAAAIALGITSYPALYGIRRLEPAESSRPPELKLEEIRQRARREERRVHERMIGSKSDFDPTTLAELRRWERMFHTEVHGSRVTTALEVEMAEGKARATIAPTPVADSISYYLNRSNEVAWMLLRTFPYLQLKPGLFGPAWAEKWDLLDQAFAADNADLSEQGKPVFGAIRRLLDTKFPFKPEATSYVDRGHYNLSANH